MPESTTTPRIDLSKIKLPFGELYKGNEELKFNLQVIEDHMEAIADIVKATQKRCPHKGPFKEEFARPEKRDKALVSRICCDCGMSIEKPAGKYYEICERCWGPMIHRPGDVPSLYHCKLCNHPTMK